MAIEDVCKIKIKKEPFLCKKDMSEEEKKLFDHMFEVYLRDDYEDLYAFRDEEVKVAEEVRRSASRARSVRPDLEGKSDNKVSRLDLSRILNKSMNTSRPPSSRSVGRFEKMNETLYDKLIKRNLNEQRESKLIRVPSTFIKSMRENSERKVNRVV